MKKTFYSYTFCYLLILPSVIIPFVTSTAYTRDLNGQNSVISISKMIMPIPIEGENNNYTLEDEIADRIYKAMEQLWVYDNIVGIEIDSSNYMKDSLIVDFSELSQYWEAIIISDANMYQTLLQGDGGDSYFTINESIFHSFNHKKEQQYSENIYTEISFTAHFFDIEKQEYLGSVNVESFHNGGDKEKSRKKALKNLEKKIYYELMRIYRFSTEVADVSDGLITLPIGSYKGVKKDMLFNVIEPDRIWTIEDEEYFVDGGRAGFAKVINANADTSWLKMVRQWRIIYPNCWVSKQEDPIHGIEVKFSPNSTASYANLGIFLNISPMQKYDWGFGVQIIKVLDSYGDTDYGFGINGYGTWRFINTPSFDFRAKIGINMDVPFKKDDYDETVNTLLFSSTIGLVSEIPVTGRFDFILNAGYRFAVKSNTWESAGEDETFPAYWFNAAPQVNNSGLVITMGFRYLLY